MSNRTLQKEVEKARKSSTPNHLNAKTSGANRSTRSRAPLVRKCCACEATDSHKTNQKSPQKSLGVANKTTTANASSVNQRKQCSSTYSSTVSRKVNSAQVVQKDCRSESKATTPVSACTPLVVRQKATIVAKKKAEGEQKLEPVSQQTTSIRKPTKTPQTESKVATSRKNLLKQFESASIAGSSSKQSSKTINSSPSNKLNKSSVSKQPTNKELKGRSTVKEVTKKKLEETNASKGKLKVPTDVHSVNTKSDCSSDSEDDLHITWDGFEEDYTVGENCRLCDKDLSVRPQKEDEHESEYSTLPVSAVLPCAHVFHCDCLDLLEVDNAVPLCIFCESLSS